MRARALVALKVVIQKTIYSLSCQGTKAYLPSLKEDATRAHCYPEMASNFVCLTANEWKQITCLTLNYASNNVVDSTVVP